MQSKYANGHDNLNVEKQGQKCYGFLLVRGGMVVQPRPNESSSDR